MTWTKLSAYRTEGLVLPDGTFGEACNRSGVGTAVHGDDQKKEITKKRKKTSDESWMGRLLGGCIILSEI